MTFAEFKMQCDTCDRIGTFASQNREDRVSVAILIPAGWQIRTWLYRPGMSTDLRVLCPDCVAKAATHYESWKDGVMP